jgi:hypothetical protein
MKCDQCAWSVVTYGGRKVFLHEAGCPNYGKNLWDAEEGKWVAPVDEEDNQGE